MNDLDLEMLAAELARRGRDRESIIFAICREHALQWSEVAPMVDHVLAVQAAQIGPSTYGLRLLLYLAVLVIGGGLISAAGLEAFNAARASSPDAGLWEWIKISGSLIFGAPKLWSQVILGGLGFAYGVGRLLALVAHLQPSRDPPS